MRLSRSQGRSSRRSVVLLAFFAVMALVAAACGGGSSATTTTAAGTTTTGGATGTTAASTTQTTGAPYKGTILLGGKVITWGPAYCASLLNYFAQQNLDITLTVSSQGAAAAMAALVSGDAVSAMTGAPAAVSPIRAGAAVKLLFVASGAYGAQLSVSNKWIAKTGVGPDAPLAQRVQALKGAKLGIYNPGGSVDQLWRYLLPKYGLNPDTDVQLVAMQNAQGQFAAMANGQIDGMGASPPYGARVEQQGFGKIYIQPTEIPGLAKYPYLVGSANDSMIQQHPEVIKGIVKAVSEGLQSLKTNPNECKPLLRKEFAETDDASFEAGWQAMLSFLPDTVVITQDYYNSLVAFAQAQGKPLDIPYSQLVASDIANQAVNG